MPVAIQITQRDLAQACRVHPSTICLALNNSPSIPLLTRQRIQEMAQKLGYQPNVAARNLAFLRAEKKESVNLPLAWINQEAERGFWHTHPEARVCYEGARRRALEVGYYLEEFWLQEPRMRLARLLQIIRARGVQGVLFPIHRAWDPTLFNASWDDFSTVSFNDHRAAQWMDVVCPDYYQNIDLTLRQVKGLGFERIGFVLSSSFDATTDGLACCRYLRFQSELATDKRTPVCMLGGESRMQREQWAKWYSEHRPDAIVTHREDRGEWIVALADEVPVFNWGMSCPEGTTGVDENADAVARMAVDCLSDKIRRFERGFGTHSRRHLIKGTWQNGLERTARAVA